MLRFQRSVERICQPIHGGLYLSIISEFDEHICSSWHAVGCNKKPLIDLERLFPGTVASRFGFYGPKLDQNLENRQNGTKLLK